MTRTNNIFVGLVWHNFSMPANPLKVLLVAASKGLTETVSSLTRV